MAHRETPKDDSSSSSERPRAERNTQRTPAADMQPEDTGTEASGNDTAESAMKQEQKTSAEGG